MGNKMFKFLMLIIIGYVSISETLALETQAAFIKKFMQTQLEENKRKYTDREKLEFIDKDYFIENNLDPFYLKLNGYPIHDYKILGASGPYIDVQLIRHNCGVIQCDNNHWVKLQVTKHKEQYFLIPSNHDKKYIDYWQQDVRGKYHTNGGDTSSQSISSQESINLAHAFMNTLLNKNKKEYSNIDRVRYISKNYFIKNNINPLDYKLNTHRVDEYKIVGSHGPFIDIKVISYPCVNAGNCKGDHIQKLKIIYEHDRLYIMPSGHNNQFKLINYWWQDIKGKYDG